MAQRTQLPSFGPAAQPFEQGAKHLPNQRILRMKAPLHPHLPPGDFPHLFPAQSGGAQQHAQVEHDALVHAVVRRSGVKASRREKRCLSRRKLHAFSIQRQGKAAGPHKENFRFLMPVIGHFITGVSAVDIVVIQRKFL